MKKLFSLLITLTLLAFSCEKTEVADGTPECIANKVKDFHKTSVCGDANVKEYLFQEATVYVFVEGDCAPEEDDRVYTTKCKLLGYVGGEFSNDTLNGEHFYDNAKFVDVIWTK